MSDKAGEDCFTDNLRVIGPLTPVNVKEYNLYKGLLLLAKSVSNLESELHKCSQEMESLTQEVRRLESR